jgi:hypothetical protein
VNSQNITRRRVLLIAGIVLLGPPLVINHYVREQAQSRAGVPSALPDFNQNDPPLFDLTERDMARIRIRAKGDEQAPMSPVKLPTFETGLDPVDVPKVRPRHSELVWDRQDDDSD